MLLTGAHVTDFSYPVRHDRHWCPDLHSVFSYPQFLLHFSDCCVYQAPITRISLPTWETGKEWCLKARRAYMYVVHEVQNMGSPQKYIRSFVYMYSSMQHKQPCRQITIFCLLSTLGDLLRLAGSLGKAVFSNYKCALDKQPWRQVAEYKDKLCSIAGQLTSLLHCVLPVCWSAV